MSWAACGYVQGRDLKPSDVIDVWWTSGTVDRPDQLPYGEYKNLAAVLSVHPMTTHLGKGWRYARFPAPNTYRGWVEMTIIPGDWFQLWKER
jgi:hypothetical protein